MFLGDGGRVGVGDLGALGTRPAPLRGHIRAHEPVIRKPCDLRAISHQTTDTPRPSVIVVLPRGCSPRRAEVARS